MLPVASHARADCRRTGVLLGQLGGALRQGRNVLQDVVVGEQALVGGVASWGSG